MSDFSVRVKSLKTGNAKVMDFCRYVLMAAGMYLDNVTGDFSRLFLFMKGGKPLNSILQYYSNATGYESRK